MSENYKPALLVKIQSMMHSLTKSESKVADTICRKPNEILYYSIADLAKESRTSEPAVMRTCKKLGFQGYKDFKISLAKDMAAKIKYANNEISSNDDTQTVLNKVFANSIEALNITRNNMDIASLDKTVNLLFNAHKIVIVGFGNSYAIALDVRSKLIRIGYDIEAYNDPYVALSAISLMTRKDVLICISQSGYSKEIMEFANAAINRKTPVVCVTGIYSSPLSEVADVALYTSSSESSKQQILGLGTRTTMLAIFDTIYSLLNMKRSNASFEAVEDSLLKGYYLPKKK